MRKVIWMGSSRRDLRAFSDEVRDDIGVALYHAQLGLPHAAIKPLHGLGGGVLEIVADDSGGTYRAVYATRFAGCLYVLHVFYKKSKLGAKTPLTDLSLIAQRLAWAAQDFEKRSQCHES